MQKSIFFSLAAASLMLLMLSCKNQQASNPFPTKADSIQFAKMVIKTYPDWRGEQLPGPDSPGSMQPGKGILPISWDTVKSYQANYDADPKLYNPAKVAYKGFRIDPAGYAVIIGNEKIQGLYLRLGKKNNGEYTIMVLGTDSTGNLVNGASTTTAKMMQDSSGDGNGAEDDTNYDHLDPCPQNCPDNDD